MNTLAFLNLWGHELTPQGGGEEKQEKAGSDRRSKHRKKKRRQNTQKEGEKEMKIIKGDSRSKEIKKKQSMTRTVTPQAGGRGSGPGKKAEKPLKPPMTRTKKKRAF